MSNLTLAELQEFQNFQAFKAQNAMVAQGGVAINPAMKARSFRVYRQARDLVEKAQGKKALPSGTPEGPYIYGPGGVFGVGYALQQDVLSTRMEPKGLLAELPWYPSIDDFPVWAYLTGWVNETYVPPTEVCEPPSAPGAPKTCTVSYSFGRYTFRTRETEANRIGRRINRGEMRDLRFVNDPIGGTLATLLGFTGTEAMLRGNELAARMVDAGIQAQNILAPQTYTGDTANNDGEAYKEMRGLDLSITETITDFLNPTVSCPSLASIVVDFDNEKIDDPTQDIVGLFSEIMAEIQDRAEMMNFNINFENRDEFSIEMARVLFWQLTKIWPCGYITNGCAALAGDIAAVDASDQVAMRDSMRNGKFLWINGLKVAVVVDDGITEVAGDGDPVDVGCYSSNIYFTTRRVNGGVETLYVEYADYSQLEEQLAESRYFNIWSDNGIFLWTSVPNLVWCLAAVGKVEPRLVNLTPFLDAKVTNVQYCPDSRVTHRRALPSNPGYVNGGVEDGRPSPLPPFVITSPAALANGTEDVAYTPVTVTASGGTGTLAWAATGLPTGMSIHASTGVISGTPADDGAYTVTVTATDDNNVVAGRVYTLTVVP